MQILVDTHSHTIASGHAYSTLSEMARAACPERPAGSGSYGTCASAGKNVRPVLFYEL